MKTHIKGKRICIHQPDFMPWLGFFNKIAICDEFIVLDHVLNNPKDGSWTRRVRIMIGGEPNWITIPLVKPTNEVFIPIKEMRIKLDDKKFIKKIKQSISINYSKAKYFKEIYPIVENYFSDIDDYIALRNIKFINSICERLGIEKKITFSSALNCNGKATELLIEICKKVDAKTYICGGGAIEYQQDEKFAQNQIHLEFQNFNHPQYIQFNSNTFTPGLSIIDALMNCGFEKVKDFLIEHS